MYLKFKTKKYNIFYCTLSRQPGGGGPYPPRWGCPCHPWCPHGVQHQEQQQLPEQQQQQQQRAKQRQQRATFPTSRPRTFPQPDRSTFWGGQAPTSNLRNYFGLLICRYWLGLTKIHSVGAISNSNWGDVFWEKRGEGTKGIDARKCPGIICSLILQLSLYQTYLKAPKNFSLEILRLTPTCHAQEDVFTQFSQYGSRAHLAQPDPPEPITSGTRRKTSFDQGLRLLLLLL